jgi:hypothetical protein
MNHLNVFNNPYYRWWYPNCWLKNIKMFIRSIKYAYQRITRGWANCDTWDLDDYYEHIIADTLNYLADNHMGYPGNNEFPDDEIWTKYLKDMAQKFYNGNEANDVYPTPEGNKWWKWIEDHPDEYSNNPYSKSMSDEEYANAIKREEDIKEGLKMLIPVWKNLWD